MANHVVWEVTELEPHVFVVRHWRVEVEVLNVDGKKFCIWCQHYAVQENFECEHLYRWCATIPWSDYSVTAYCDPDCVWVVFFRPVVYDYSTVGVVSPPVHWKICLVN